jgi:hypothetical protein
VSRENRTAVKRRRYFTARIDAARRAGDRKAQIVEAARYLRAGFDDLPPDRLDGAVDSLVRLVDEWIPEGVAA